MIMPITVNNDPRVILVLVLITACFLISAGTFLLFLRLVGCRITPTKTLGIYCLLFLLTLALLLPVSLLCIVLGPIAGLLAILVPLGLAQVLSYLAKTSFLQAVGAIVLNAMFSIIVSIILVILIEIFFPLVHPNQVFLFGSDINTEGAIGLRPSTNTLSRKASVYNDLRSIALAADIYFLEHTVTQVNQADALKAANITLKNNQGVIFTEVLVQGQPIIAKDRKSGKILGTHNPN